MSKLKSDLLTYPNPKDKIIIKKRKKKEKEKKEYITICGKGFLDPTKKKGQPIPCSLKQQIGSCCHAGRMDWPILFPFINK